MTSAVSTMLRIACVLAAGVLPSCIPLPIQRSAAPCPLPPPPPECRSMPYTGPGMLSATWSMVPVRSLSKPGVEDLFSGDTLRGNTFAGITQQSSRTAYGTAVLPGSVIGDADVVTFSNSGPLRLPFSMAPYWDGHPTLVTPTLMVYASERPGSVGGTDLWYVVQTRGQWTSPRPLTAVNTACDELSPFYDATTSMLYFASAGHATLGGYDAMRTALRVVASADGIDSVVVEAPTNLGRPINSAADDLFPVIIGDSVYITSNRRDRTDMDVYVSYTSDIAVHHSTEHAVETDLQPNVPTEPVRTFEPATERTTVLMGTVLNDQTSTPVVDADVRATNSQTKTVVATSRTDTAGRYSLVVPVETPLTVTSQAKDLFYDSFDTTMPGSSAGMTVNLDQPLRLPTVFVLRVNFPTSVFDAPYDMTLDSNGNETSQQWTTDIDLLAANVLASGMRLRRLILTGHTDDVDTDAKNMVLGRQRVDFVIDQLVQRGVQRTLLEGRSAGERELPERRPTESTDLWRKRARRVELVKVMQE
ncbi:MAG: hypothetical protein FGM24_01815 [Candidatus Kapabacteria bacterium]|nr:hypothetical protein [Candidatus Kapabacteria bacterium]